MESRALLKKVILLFLITLTSCSKNGKPSPISTPGPSPIPSPPPNVAIAGVAPYALQHSGYDCDALIKSILDSGLPVLNYAWLYRTFDNHPGGDGAWLECVYKLNALPITRAMEVHLRNDVCDRNKNCGGYERLDAWGVKDSAAYERLLISGDTRLRAIIEAYFTRARDLIFPTLREGQGCYISYGLESNLSERAYKQLMAIGGPIFGDRCKIVYNPIGNRSPIPGTVFEKHHSSPSLSAPCIANLDGEDIDFVNRKSNYPDKVHESKIPDFVRRYQHCDMVLLWMAEDNCRRPGGFIDPRSRPASYCPSPAIQKERAKYLMVPK
jgi:hypothetical protein